MQPNFVPNNFMPQMMPGAAAGVQPAAAAAGVQPGGSVPAQTTGQAVSSLNANTQAFTPRVKKPLVIRDKNGKELVIEMAKPKPKPADPQKQDKAAVGETAEKEGDKAATEGEEPKKQEAGEEDDVDELAGQMKSLDVKPSTPAAPDPTPAQPAAGTTSSSTTMAVPKPSKLQALLASQKEVVEEEDNEAVKEPPATLKTLKSADKLPELPVPPAPLKSADKLAPLPSPPKPSPAPPARAAGEKIIYSRQFLMKLKELEVCGQRPSNFEDMYVTPGGAKTAGGGRRGNRGDRGGGGGGGGGGGDWDRGTKQPKQKQQGGGEWTRGKEAPKARNDGRKGRGGRNQQQGPPLYDGPITPLAVTENRWVPIKDDSSMIICEKKVKSLLNKMTIEKFQTLSKQFCEIKIESFEMLELIISKVYDKAIGEPSFGGIYAELCVMLSNEVTSASFVELINYDKSKAGNAFDDQEGPFYWSSNVSNTDKEIVGPFNTADDTIDAALDVDNEYPRIERGDMVTEIVSLSVEEDIFIKVMKRVWPAGEEGREEFYGVFFAVDKAEQSGMKLSKPFDDLTKCIEDGKKKNSFKFSLLNKCQDEFQKKNIYAAWEEDFAEFQTKKASMTEKEAKDMGEELEMRRVKIKKQMLGNIAFIGNLFLKSLLRSNVMHDCVMELFKITYNESNVLVDTGKPIEEEDHEALCKLFRTVGKTMDTKKNANLMTEYFNRFKKLAKDLKLNSRLRFAYQDLIELRKDRWVTRRKEESAKSLAEIRKEADREERQKQQGGGGEGRRRREG